MEKLAIRENLRVVAILRGFSESQALAATEVFAKSGINAVEVTFNTPDASKIISSIALEFGNKMLVGAGTVMSKDEVLAAKNAGASFILSPHYDPELIRETKKLNLFSVPGACTATEVVLCVRAGADMVKIFPAGTLGAEYIKNLLGPLDKTPIMAVGAVNLDNCRDFFKAGVESIGLGSSLADKTLIKEGRFSELEEKALSFVQASKKTEA